MLVIEDIDMGYDALRKRLQRLDGAKVEGGLFDQEQAQKGAWNEFGTRDNPARPWLSIAADTGAAQFATAMGDAVASVADGAAVQPALDKAGKVIADAAKDVIRSRRVGGPPLAPSTVRDKGHGIKLIDEGDMLAAITHEVSIT